MSKGKEDDMMLLRNHPKLGHQWPPVWLGFHNMEYTVPVGEKPEELLAVEKSDLEPAIILTAKYEGRKLIGRMSIEDHDLRSNLLEVLRQNIGKSIEEIGSVDLPFE